MPDAGMYSANIADVRLALKLNRTFLIGFLLGDQVTLPVPDFHVESLDLLLSNASRIALALPRDHAKTTLAKIAAVWHIVFTDFRFLAYVSHTHTVALEAVKDIIAFITSDNFAAVFGKVRWVTEQGGTGFFRFTIRLERKPGEWYDKTVIIKALGAGQQVRGLNVDNTRPDLVIVDDLEDNDNVETKDQIRKLRRWVYGPFFRFVNKLRNKIIWLGNMLSTESLLYTFCKEGSGWHYRLYGAIKADGTPLWPERFPLEDIGADFNASKKAGTLDIWFAEVMNTPMAEGGGLILAEEIPYLDDAFPDDIQYGFLTIDPADSDSERADEAAIAAHGWRTDTAVWQIVDYKHAQGMGPLDIFRTSLEFCIKWRIRVIGIEAIALQTVYIKFFKYLLLERGLYGQIAVVPVHGGKQNKTARLRGWCGYLKNKSYCLSMSETDVTQQLLAYNPATKTNRDDLIDACAYGPQMISMYLPQIMTKIGPIELPKHRRLVEYAEI